MNEMKCLFCGAPETERPLFSARYNGAPVAFCPKCLPTLIHGLTPSEVKQVLDDKALAKA